MTLLFVVNVVEDVIFTSVAQNSKKEEELCNTQMRLIACFLVA